VSHIRGGRRCIKKCHKIWSRGGQGHWSGVLQIVAKVDTWALKECLPVGAKDVHSGTGEVSHNRGEWGGGGEQSSIGRSTHINGLGVTHGSEEVPQNRAQRAGGVTQYRPGVGDTGALPPPSL
jgi:hypothetical protein